MARRKPKGLQLIEALVESEVETAVEVAAKEDPILTAILVPCCANCRFFFEAAHSEPRFGHCHAVPPAVGTTGYRFPNLPASEWCGYFEERC